MVRYNFIYKKYLKEFIFMEEKIRLENFRLYNIFKIES